MIASVSFIAFAALIVFMFALPHLAIADTQPEAGDVKQAPLVSGGGARSAIAPEQSA